MDGLHKIDRRDNAFYQFVYMACSFVSIVLLAASLWKQFSNGEHVGGSDQSSVFAFLLSVFIFACGKAFDLYSDPRVFQKGFIRIFRIVSMTAACCSLLAAIVIVVFAESSSFSITKDCLVVFIALALVNAVYDFSLFILLCKGRGRRDGSYDVFVNYLDKLEGLR